MIVSATLPDQLQQAAGTPGWRERDLACLSVTDALSISLLSAAGHLHQLRTLVDTAVTVFSRVIGGGGASDVHLVLDVPDLLHFAQVDLDVMLIET